MGSIATSATTEECGSRVMKRLFLIPAVFAMFLYSPSVWSQEALVAVAGSHMEGSCPGMATIRLRYPKTAKAGAQVFLTNTSAEAITAEKPIPPYNAATKNVFTANFRITDPRWCGHEAALHYLNPGSQKSPALIVTLPSNSVAAPAVFLITHRIACNVPTVVLLGIERDPGVKDLPVKIGTTNATRIAPGLAAVEVQVGCDLESTALNSVWKIEGARNIKIVGAPKVEDKRTVMGLSALVFSLFGLFGFAILAWWGLKRFSLVSSEYQKLSSFVSERSNSLNSRLTRLEGTPNSSPVAAVSSSTRDAGQGKASYSSSPNVGPGREKAATTQSELAAATSQCSPVQEITTQDVERMALQRESVPSEDRDEATRLAIKHSEPPLQRSRYHRAQSSWQQLVEDYNRAVLDPQQQREFTQSYRPGRLGISNPEEVAIRNSEPIFASDERGDLFVIEMEAVFYVMPTFDHPWQGDFVRNWSHLFLIDTGTDQRLREPAEAINQAGSWTVKQKGRLTRVP